MLIDDGNYCHEILLCGPWTWKLQVGWQVVGEPTKNQFEWGSDGDWGEGAGDAPLWVQDMALVGTRRQSSRKLQGFSTLKSLTLD